MRTVICKRCHEDVPKYSTRQSKLHGGRICRKCAQEFGKVIEAARMGGYYRPSRPVIPEAPTQRQRQGAINLVRGMVRSLFRRRGVQ